MMIGREDGVALIVAMLVMFVLSVVGIAAINTATMETRVSGYYRESRQAFYAADYGSQEIGWNRALFTDSIMNYPKTNLIPPGKFIDSDNSTMTYVGEVRLIGDNPWACSGYGQRFKCRFFEVEVKGYRMPTGQLPTEGGKPLAQRTIKFINRVILPK